MLRTRTAIAAGVAALALSSPAAAGAEFVPHPDTLDRLAAAEAAGNPQGGDARDRARAAQEARRLREAGLAERPVTVAAPSAPVTSVTPVAEAPGGFDWDDAGIGAAAMLGVVCAGAGALLLTPRRRERMALPRH